MRAAARLLLLPTVVLVALLAMPSSVVAEVIELPRPTDCPKYPLAPDGSRRQTFDRFEASSGIAALPPRTVTELEPGERSVFCVGFQNRGEDPVDLELDVVDVAADDEGLPTSQRDAEDRGASRWVQLPTEQIRALPPGDIAWLVLDVSVPADALPGSSYASVLATDVTPLPDGAEQVQAIPSIASQLFFDIPGDADRDGAVRNVRSPRVIWWDGPGIGDLPVLENFRGLGIATIRYSWANTGDFTSDVRSRLVIKSDLGGKTVATIDLPETVVLARSERAFEVTWKRDIPLVGRFTPVLEVNSRDGGVERHELKPIWVIPAWWYLLAVALAIALPLWWRRRSKRRYQALLARVEAAEARAADGTRDGDWDGDSDEWE